MSNTINNKLKRRSLADHLENHPNPGGRIDVLTHGILKQIVTGQEQAHGLTPGTALTPLRETLAKAAVGLSRQVKGAGIPEGLAGLGIMIGLDLLRKDRERAPQSTSPIREDNSRLPQQSLPPMQGQETQAPPPPPQPKQGRYNPYTKKWER